MTTLSKDIDRGDILIQRDGDCRFGVHWTEDRRDGNGYVPKDLSKWKAKFDLLVDDIVEHSSDCFCDSFGNVIATIKAGTLSGTRWDSRKRGSWRIRGFGPDGEVEILAWGYYRIV